MSVHTSGVSLFQSVLISGVSYRCISECPYFRGVLFQCPYFRGALISRVFIFQGVFTSGMPYFRGPCFRGPLYPHVEGTETVRERGREREREKGRERGRGGRSKGGVCCSLT